MFSINTYVISGNITKDPELRATNSGTPVCNGSICYNSRRKGQSGDWEDVPNFFDFVAFGKVAEVLARKQKGEKILLNGELTQRSWESKEGERRSKVELLVREFVDAPRQNAAQKPAKDDSGEFEEDIPF
jgi:single-strand DNA-binding protein